jgi:uncharacterized protein VirK/YbjX
MARDERFGWKSAFKTASFLALNPTVSRQWLGFMQVPARAKLWLHHPRLLDKVLRPYLNGKWGPQERANALMAHYSWLRHKFTRSAIHRFYLEDPVELAQCSTRGTTGALSLHLGYNGSFEREGDLTLGLYRHVAVEAVAKNSPELVVAITLSVVLIEGCQTLCIGCVQTRHDSRALETLKHITKDMHGLRPKTLLMDMAKLLARRWQMGLYGIDPDVHPFTSLRYRLSQRKRQAVEMMRDAYVTLWQEQGGRKVSGGWYAFPVEAPLRPLSELPSHKRSMYTKRFAMMADLDHQIQLSLAALERTGVALSPS